ncbi:MAG: hypothetical protein FOGNACKC_00875 [Anaerolineae bacterium]|nr:hypothetical protein [Anaerolineae bacterium]
MNPMLYNKKREERLAAMHYTDTLRVMETSLAKAQAENEDLRARLAEAEQLLALTRAELEMVTAEVGGLKARAESADRLRREALAAMEIHKQKHHTLSQVIRLGLTPERYHELRSLVSNE